MRGPRETPKPGLCDLPARTWHRWPTRRAYAWCSKPRARPATPLPATSGGARREPVRDGCSESAFGTTRFGWTVARGGQGDQAAPQPDPRIELSSGGGRVMAEAAGGEHRLWQLPPSSASRCSTAISAWCMRPSHGMTLR